MSDVQDELIELRGLRFHYRDWTARQAGATDLVLLHGYTGHSRSWDHFASHMTDCYRVIALDQRGHGESGWAPADQYGIDDMVQDLRAFVAALGLQRFTLCGLSMGGMVAMHYAGARPPELGALVIVDIGPELVASGSARIQSGQKESDVFVSKDAAFTAARMANSVPPEHIHRHRVNNNLMRLSDGRWTYRYDRALRSPSTLGMRDPAAGWAACANINVRTQLLRGANSDILSAESAARMIKTIPGAQFAEVKDAGHSIPLDSPDGFLAAARQFLTG